VKGRIDGWDDSVLYDAWKRQKMVGSTGRCVGRQDEEKDGRRDGRRRKRSPMVWWKAHLLRSGKGRKGWLKRQKRWTGRRGNAGVGGIV
jgi:hypothetical protein